MNFWGITTYFNPLGNASRLRNLSLFSSRVRRQGLKLLVVELTHTDAPSAVPEGTADRHIHLESDSALWQKERLLNLALKELPASCTKVAWLDGDVIFENDRWVAEAAAALEEKVIIQPFESVCWLAEGQDTTTSPILTEVGLGEGKRMHGMAATLASHPQPRMALKDYFAHGHCGFAWAARRSLLDEHGFYDRHVLGGGDLVIAQCIYGNEDFWNRRHVYSIHITRPELNEIKTWGQGFHRSIGDQIGYVPGRVLHLWHGSIKSRSYVERLKILKEINYDPSRDLKKDRNGCWTWAAPDRRTLDRIDNYFYSREESACPLQT